jgi:rubrerythrin
MAIFTCEKCGANVDTRCKPKKCPTCGEAGCLNKTSPPPPPKKGK